MNKDGSIISIGFTLFAVIALCASIYLMLQRVDRYLELKARNDCAQISRYSTINPGTNTTVYYPVEEVYRKCLNEKGY